MMARLVSPPRRAHRVRSLAASLLLVGCGEPVAGASRAEAAPDQAPAAELPSEAGARSPADASARDAEALELADAAGTDLDAHVEPAPRYVPPDVTYPAGPAARPFLLSELGLYVDIVDKTLAPDLRAYEPRYPLWSDGAGKRRYLRLPAGASIDNTDPDHWQFPVGAVLFKEFRSGERRLETRVIARTGPGARDYFFGAFVWRDDESDAELRWDGASNVRQTAHDVPSVTQCGTCHNGEPGRVLGLSAVQTTAAGGTALRVPESAPYRVPGAPVQAQALGYLHANCGHCHNPQGSARPDTDLALRLSVSQQTIEQTSAYLTSVGVALQSFQGTPLRLRVAPGLPAQSGLYFRMHERGPRTQMPPIASEQADAEGLALIEALITTLAPPTP